MNQRSERGQLCPRKFPSDDSRTRLSALLQVEGSWRRRALGKPGTLARIPTVDLRGRTTVRSRHCRGFTLIELMLVLVILGILAAIVVPKFSGRTEQARQTAAQSQIATFGTALDAFEVDNGYYPKGKNGLNDLVQLPRDTQNWKGPYLKSEIPNDPWGHPYSYECPGKHNPSGYDLMSMGPDGRVGGDDDVTNWQSANKKQ